MILFKHINLLNQKYDFTTTNKFMNKKNDFIETDKFANKNA